MNTVEMISRDIYLRHTSTKGESYVQSHLTWDHERFIASQKDAAAKLNSEQKDDEPRLASVEQITEEQYRKERKA
jgi:hypothetical protein